MIAAGMYNHSINNGSVWRSGGRQGYVTAIAGRLSETQRRCARYHVVIIVVVAFPRYCRRQLAGEARTALDLSWLNTRTEGSTRNVRGWRMFELGACEDEEPKRV